MCRFSPGALAKLLSNARNLKMVDVSYGSRIGPEHLEPLRRLRPDVKLVALADWMPQTFRSVRGR